MPFSAITAAQKQPRVQTQVALKAQLGTMHCKFTAYHSQSDDQTDRSTWEGLNNGVRNSRAVAYVSNDAPARPQPLPKLFPNLHLHGRQYNRNRAVVS